MIIANWQPAMPCEQNKLLNVACNWIRNARSIFYWFVPYKWRKKWQVRLHKVNRTHLSFHSCLLHAHDFIAFIAIVLIWHNLSAFTVYTMRAFIYLNFLRVRNVMHEHLSKGIYKKMLKSSSLLTIIKLSSSPSQLFSNFSGSSDDIFLMFCCCFTKEFWKEKEESEK